MIVYVVTEEPYHENSLVLAVCSTLERVHQLFDKHVDDWSEMFAPGEAHRHSAAFPDVAMWGRRGAEEWAIGVHRLELDAGQREPREPKATI